MRGILLMMLATAGFAGTDACAKWLNQREPVLQTVAVRDVGAFLLTVWFLNPKSRPGITRTVHPCCRSSSG